MQVRHEPVEPRVLREDERLVVARHRLEQLDEALQLARAAGERPAGREHHLRVVAHLLQLAQHREHRAAAAEAALVLLDPRHPAVDRRLVEARLLEREPAVLLRDRDLRQLELDLGAVLRPPQDERLHHRAQSLERPRSPFASIGRAKLRWKRSREPRRPGLTMSMIAQSSSSRFSIGVPVIASVRRASRRRRARARLVAGFFTSCASSSSSRSQRTADSDVDVARGDVVRGDDDVARAGDVDQLGAAEPLTAVVDVDAKGRREALDLSGPLAGDAHRADDQGGAERIHAVLLPLGGEHRDRLHRLAEAHVVGEDGADPEVAEQPQPAVTALLEREERLRHRRRRAEGVKRRSSSPAMSAPSVSSSVTSPSSRPASSSSIPETARTRSTTDPSRRRSRKSSAFSTSERRSACQRPPIRISGSLAAASSISSSSVSVVSPIASFQSNRARASVVSRPLECAATLVAVRLTRRRLDGGDPVPRQQHRHADLLQPRDRRAEKEADVVVAELDPRRARPGRTRSRLQRGRARSGRAGGARRFAGRPSGGSRRPRRRRRGATTWGGRASGRRPPAATARARRRTGSRPRALSRSPRRGAG